MNAVRSIRGRLLIFGLCISLIPIAAITTIGYFHARSTIKRQTMEKLRAVAESRELHVLSFLAAEKNQAMAFSSDGFIRDSLERINLQGPDADLTVRELNRHLRVNKKLLVDKNLVEISVINPKGEIVSSSNEEVIGIDISSDEDFKYIQQGRGAIRLKRPFHYPQAGTDCFSIFTPLTSKGFHERIGVLVNVLKLEALSDVTYEWTGLGETGEVYLVDRDGIMLTESRFIEGTPLRQVVDTEPVRRSAQGEEMTGIYRNYRGIPVVGASMYMPKYDWTLLVEIDKLEAFAPLKTLGTAALIMGLIGVAAVTSVGIIFAISMSRPIKRLTDAMKRFSDGDLECRVQLARRDEIGSLASSFNIMAEEIVEKTRKLVRTEELVKEIAERKRAEEALRESEGRYRTLTDDVLDSSKVGVFILDKDFRVVWVNKALESYFGLKRDDVIGKDKRQLIKDKIHHIFEEGEKFKEVIFKTYDNNTYVENFVCHVLPGDGREERWLNHWSQPITAGLYEGGRVEHYTDISVRKQAEEELKQSTEKLRRSLGGTIQALASTVETRDPYTASHQRRVADLARTIAREMGLSREQIDGIRMAGVIHDIGKIAVPAEILSKPGRLTKTEHNMIKTHPQAGYDILKEVEFPWPVAKIVLQHQERMDGSGYPAGLSGEDIILEARILGVADVVEAMSSHRPYRPALGIDKALEEISKNRGVLYDANAVDACVRLFTEKGFKFK
ncbi:MAG: HD domain-containing phosphohydrolase [Candidatus Brocadiales bacterium]